MLRSLVPSIPTPAETGSIQPDDPRLRQLQQLFGVPFSAVDVERCTVAATAEDLPPGNWEARAVICREVADRQQPAFIDEVGPLLVLAIPLPERNKVRYVAVAGLVTAERHPTPTGSTPPHPAGTDLQIFWPEQTLLAAAGLFVEREQLAQRAAVLEDHVDGLSENLSHTYEEISLLHRIAGHLKISDGIREVAHLAAEWLHNIVSSEAVVACFLPADGTEDATGPADTLGGMLVQGRCPISETRLAELIDTLNLDELPSARVMNHGVTNRADWRFPEIRELVIVSLRVGDRRLGYLAALNHSAGREFGSVEASLLNSVATMLGIHYGNSELFQAQSDLLSAMVQSLVSAIDAKDPYTCGHSHRVARVARRLAEELGCDDEMLNTIYLSGLLHDIGKIGINDHVLRKAGRLTEAEYEHIKQHPQLGFNILKDIRQIKDALPGVLYHHEAWDGSGYPAGLAGENIPWLARILAVADAFDAMGSDRSYRTGMPDEQLDQILRQGAGHQWDARVVEAFFAIRDEVRDIVNRERERIQLDALAWS